MVYCGKFGLTQIDNLKLPPVPNLNLASEGCTFTQKFGWIKILFVTKKR